MAAASDRVKEVLRFKSNMDSGMFKPLQLAAVEALNQPDSWYEEVNKTYRERRSLAESILATLGCAYDTRQVGMFLWGKIPDAYKDGIALADEVLDQALVFITPGNIFGKNGHDYVRISLCSNQEILQGALERITEMKSENR